MFQSVVAFFVISYVFRNESVLIFNIGHKNCIKKEVQEAYFIK